MKRNRKIEKIGDIYRDAGLFKKGRKKYLTAYVRVNWEKVVGERVAKNVDFVGVMQKELLLYAENGIWANEIKLYEEDIVSKVNLYAGENLVRKIRFVRIPPEKKPKFKENKETLKREIKLDNLTFKEEEEIKNKLSKVTDKDVRDSLFKLKSSAKRLNNYRERYLRKCEVCGKYIEEKYCPYCELENNEKLRKKVRELLKEAPFLSYGEIKEEIPEAGPDFIRNVRVEMAQNMAKNIDGSKGVTLDAQILTMLFRGISPEYITDKVVIDTLKEMKYNLAVPYSKNNKMKNSIEKSKNR